MPDTHPQYPNPAVSEAVFELRTQSEKPWDGTFPGRIYERIQTRFPGSRMVHRISTGSTPDVQLKDGLAVGPLLQMQALVECSSSDGLDVVLIGQDSISISRKRPYVGWERLRDGIAHALKAYVEVVQPTSATRAGLRYINHFYMAEGRDFADYFNVYPYLGGALPQRVSDVRMHLILVPEDRPDYLNLQMYVVPLTQVGEKPFALDLDCYLADLKFRDTVEGALSWADAAHDFVYRVFEASVTDTVRTVLRTPAEAGGAR
jgi:uncharacterized protein (TIGR04255 family)